MPSIHEQGEVFEDAPRYSLLFVIHGDGDYIFHDTDGEAHRADEAVLASARTIAERNPNAEVFIFHQTRRRHFLFVVPRRDGRAYYYRSTRLVAERSYWRDQGAQRFDPEVAIYREFAAAYPRPSVRMFFYFGHEVPEFDGEGYDASYPGRSFTVPDLADGLRRMAGDSTMVDLAVLGTCFGGTPYTIRALAPYARYIVASPENLHRSYFDLRPLQGLDLAWDAPAFAGDFARNAFEQLTEEIQTAISVVVYDANGVRGYVDAVEGAYERRLSALEGSQRASIEHCDCAEDSVYALPGIAEGLQVFYRAPRFGRSKQKQSHSGWGCWKAAE